MRSADKSRESEKGFFAVLNAMNECFEIRDPRCADAPGTAIVVLRRFRFLLLGVARVVVNSDNDIQKGPGTQAACDQRFQDETAVPRDKV